MNERLLESLLRQVHFSRKGQGESFSLCERA